MQMSIEGVFTHGKMSKAIDSLMDPKRDVEDRREQDVDDPFEALRLWILRLKRA